MLFFGNLVSQDSIKYKVSSPYQYIETPLEFFNYEPDYNFTNADTSKTLLIKNYEGYINMQLFDNESMVELNRTQFRTKEKINASFISTISWLGGKLYCFYNKKDKNEYHFLCREISLDSCDFLGEEIKLFKTSEVPEEREGLWRISEDKSKLLVFYRSQSNNNTDSLSKDEFSFVLFNQELNELARKQIQMPYSVIEATYIQYFLNNDANFYTLIKIPVKNTSISQFESFRFELYNVDFSLGSLNKIELPINDYLITDIALSRKNRKTLVCTGFYTKENIEQEQNQYFLKQHLYSIGVNGVFLFEINSNKITSERSYEIPDTSYNIYGTEKKSKLNNLKFRYLNYQADKTFILIGEQLRSPYTGIQHTERTIFSSYEYGIRCKDILVIKFDAKEEISWIRRLPKRQFHKDQMGDRLGTDVSFNYQHIQGSHYFVFIDNIRNMKMSSNQKPEWHLHKEGGFFTLYRLDDMLGTYNKTSLFRLRGINLGKGVKKKYSLSLFSIHQTIRTSDSSFMIEFNKNKKEDVWVKIEAH